MSTASALNRQFSKGAARLLPLGIVIGVGAGCAQTLPVVGGTLPVTSWTEVQPVMQANCTSCHSGPDPAAGYDATTYLGAIGVSAPTGSYFIAATNSGVATAGDPNSTLITTLDPPWDVQGHNVSSAVKSTITAWVVQGLAYANSQVHQPGLLNPADPNFHGKLLESRGWDFALCQSCHGNDFSGGAAGQSCTQCHQAGPTDCTTCHQGIAQDGNHGAHLAGQTYQHDFDCSECHIKPEVWSQPGHILDADGGVITAPVQVTFGALANATPDGSTRAGPATFDAASGSCSNVYCHGGSFTDSEARVPAPKWTDTSADVICGSCHGLPPESHGGAAQCNMCHSDVDSNGNLTDLSQHITGQVALLPNITSSTCTACHGGDDGNPAPPRDLDGGTATTLVTVGAHQSHLNPTHGYTAPMPCTSCHDVPDNVLSAGHIVTGGDPIVFPADSASTSLAFTNGASPFWSPSSATCTNTYCHGGGGAPLSQDESPNLHREPLWTDVGGQQVYCGSCHGIPPKDANHNDEMPLYTCATCHPGSVDSTGFPIVSQLPDGGLTSLHINGVIDYVAP